MFNSKQKTLFKENKTKQTSVEQPFLKAIVRDGLKTKAETRSGNDALKYNTTGNDFVDQFAKVTNFRQPRSYEDISKDMRKLWVQNPELTLKFTLYIRMITRTIHYTNGDKTEVVQRGQGLKHEGIMRMMWIAINYPEVFWNNIIFYVVIASWKDIIQMLQYDLVYHGWEGRVLNWNIFEDMLYYGLTNTNTVNLVKKYLPQIKARNKCTTVESQANTIIGKWIADFLFSNDNENKYELYRKYKVSGEAHEWQQLISQKRFNEIDFDKIHGRALAQLVSGKFLTNQKLEKKYEKWIESKPVAKYTGYVYELLSPVKDGFRNKDLKKYQENTINKQFYGLIETAKKDMNPESNLIVVLDTSYSMASYVPGTKVSAYDVGKAMALYFSYLLEGPFRKSFFEFANKCELKFWTGDTPVKNLQNDTSEAYGSTNFQSVADTFVKFKQQGVAEEHFPSGILCISDGEFNRTSSGETNYKVLIDKLKNAGFSSEYINNFKVVLWDIPNGFYGSVSSKPKFEDFADSPNLFHVSGLDGSIISFITGNKKSDSKSTPKTSEELFLAAMDQEVLNKIII